MTLYGTQSLTTRIGKGSGNRSEVSRLHISAWEVYSKTPCTGDLGKINYEVLLSNLLVRARGDDIFPVINIVRLRFDYP